MKKVHLICAARPNFMKVAPLYHALKDESWCCPKIVHTGQHYDYKMSQTFFEDLGLPTPDFSLEIGSGSHAEQTAKVMMAYETLCVNENPDLVVVAGDVNSTLACTLAAKKIHLKVAHLEAGLRSFDRTMPEEINRIVTDTISDILWTPSADADENLMKEGISKTNIERVGNIMIDAYKLMESKINEEDLTQKFPLLPKNYAVVTLHRPINVDNPEQLLGILERINSMDFPCVFPVHPRTKQTLSSLKLDSSFENIKFIDPLSYVQFMSLVKTAKFVITDSGGIQEETTYLGVPCFTLRETTERPVTVTHGTNQLVNLDNLIEKIQYPKTGVIPELWDGFAADRVVTSMRQHLL